MYSIAVYLGGFMPSFYRIFVQLRNSCLEYLLQGGDTEVFNLGNGNGFSIKQVIETAREVTGQEIKVQECARRLGDPPMLFGSSDKARSVLGWNPHDSDLKQILAHAWQWHQQRHG